MLSLQKPVTPPCQVWNKCMCVYWELFNNSKEKETEKLKFLLGHTVLDSLVCSSYGNELILKLGVHDGTAIEIRITR